jgi:hypothetical protein
VSKNRRQPMQFDTEAKLALPPILMIHSNGSQAFEVHFNSGNTPTPLITRGIRVASPDGSAAPSESSAPLHTDRRKCRTRHVCPYAMRTSVPASFLKIYVFSTGVQWITRRRINDPPNPLLRSVVEHQKRSAPAVRDIGPLVRSLIAI